MRLKLFLELSVFVNVRDVAQEVQTMSSGRKSTYSIREKEHRFEMTKP